MKYTIRVIMILFIICKFNYAYTQTRIISGTFLGNEKRNFYGTQAPSKLNVKWKRYLGKGRTVISRRLGERIWAGAGWTGQPLVVLEDSIPYLIQGAYDHNLKKINANTGEIIWQYKFDDVIKGTGTIWHNKKATNKENEFIILQGSRLGTEHFLDAKIVPSYRAVSYNTGKELWTMNVKWGASYSRDVDGSALVINDTAYIGLENALFTVFDPDPKNAKKYQGLNQPVIFEEHKLYHNNDKKKHKGNLVTESSPCRLGNRIYVASGSGHVYGYNLTTRKIDWDFFIGSDIDGSAIATFDSCILVSIEKQYIDGRGGILKLDPKKDPKDAVVWFQPTADKKFASWEGGMIGSASTNDYYIQPNDSVPHLAAFTAIDGYLYVVNHAEVTDKKELGFDNKTYYNTPKIVFKKYIGPSISTALIVDNKVIAAGYNGIYLYEFDKDMNFKLLDKYPTGFESTPVVYNGRIYVASRDGNLYCFGD
ncbi:MAG: PQQ-binding-like beta-propeller repeat protein [Bacteroidales bacterium]|jgi:outer membrane protein assembly factor BamB|nr:PQQ-binding-like beta-propeller repeat protein [Bacteroidales bacterium]